MSEWCATRTSQQALEELAAAHLPAGPVLSPAEVRTHTQVEGMGMVEQVYVPHIGREAPLTRAPVEMGGSAAPIRTPPAAVGQHNVEVLRELGFSDAEIGGLTARGVV